MFQSYEHKSTNDMQSTFLHGLTLSVQMLKIQSGLLPLGLSLYTANNVVVNERSNLYCSNVAKVNCQHA